MICFLHSLTTSGLKDFDGNIVLEDRNRWFSLFDLSEIRTKIQHTKVIGTGSLKFSDLDDVGFFEVKYLPPTEGGSLFRLTNGGLRFTVTSSPFQFNKYKTEIIDGIEVIVGQK